MKHKSFYHHICTQLAVLCPSFVQLVPLQLIPDGNGSVDREKKYHADELRLLLR